MFEALTQEYPVSVARRVQEPVCQPSRTHPGHRGWKCWQQHRCSERLVGYTHQKQQPESGANQGWNRVSDEQSEGHTGDCPTPNPQSFCPTRNSLQDWPAFDRFPNQLIGNMGMHNYPGHLICAIEPSIERGRKRIIHAFGVDTDDDRSSANQRCGLLAAHDLSDALDRKRVRATVIVEQYLISAAVEPHVGTARIV